MTLYSVAIVSYDNIHTYIYICIFSILVPLGTATCDLLLGSSQMGRGHLSIEMD